MSSNDLPQKRGNVGGGEPGAKRRRTSKNSVQPLHDDFTDIMDNINSDKPIFAEQREVREKQLNELRNLLKEAAKMAILCTGEGDPVTIEVEARIGTISPKKFLAGITADEFEWIKTYLDRSPGWNSYSTVTTDYMYPCSRSSDQGSYRVQRDEDGAFESSMLKIKEKQINLSFSGRSYDVRVGVAKEIDKGDVGLSPDEYQIARKKERHSFEKDETPWRIDLTKVTTSQPKHPHVGGRDHSVGGKLTYEMEFEIISEHLPMFLQEDYLLITSEKFYDHIDKLLENLVQRPAQQSNGQVSKNIPSFPKLDVNLVTNESESFALKGYVGKAFNTDVMRDFPGSMPVTFSRRHFKTVQSTDYMVSEKSDGLRFLLLGCPKGFFFIDRKYSFYQIGGCEKLTDLLYPTAVSLLDGELVRHLEKDEPMFLIFDTIMINDVFYGSHPLLQRLHAFKEGITRKFVEGKMYEEMPFNIAAKNFQNKDSLCNVLHCIKECKTSQGEFYRYYKDSGRGIYHKTDGLILTPTHDPYSMRTVQNLFKWKYLDLQSIDFRVVRSSDKPSDFQMYTGIPGGETECFKTSFMDEDVEKINHDWVKNKIKSNQAIMECTYDSMNGVWRYHCLRPDKNTPNFIRVAFDTLLVIAEGVSKDELCERLKVTPEKDTWGKQHKSDVGRSIQNQTSHRPPQSSPHHRKI
eukprot:TRINITY_DN12108_c0_g1_i2.p1 TRINITY_DN12108_c0_g1~~TRINITY_DN12108_c0_g1_i2.p1  ORF type:complete len:689 (-),score=112.73 TRINITY_DN12108_c0_g1_i2:335-2401(-)